MFELVKATIPYPRYNLEGTVTKLLTFDAVFVNGDASLADYRSNKANKEFYRHPGIDKIGLSLPLDYLNEKEAKHCKFSNGMFSTRTHGAYFHIDVHGEYLDAGKSLISQIKPIITFLCKRSFFKVPQRKETITFSQTTGEIISVKEEHYKEAPEDINEFIEIIYSKILLTNIEIKFDYERSIKKLFKPLDFNIIEGTLYSKDYKIYKGGKRLKSFLCIYDKAKQLDEVKHTCLATPINRIECKLFSQALSYHGSMKLLEGNFIELFQRVKPIIVKKLKKLNIDFSLLISTLPKDDMLKSILNEYIRIEGKHTESSERTEYMPVESAEHKSNENDGSTEVAVYGAEHAKAYIYAILRFTTIRTKVINLKNSFSYLIKIPLQYSLNSFSLGP